MSLRTRLFLSHAIVAIACFSLLAIGIALLIGESRSAERIRILSVRASDFLLVARNNQQQPNDNPLQFFERVNRISNRDTSIRILLLNDRGVVLADNARPQLQSIVGTQLDVTSRPQEVLEITTSGEFIGRDQRRWQYVVVLSPNPAPNNLPTYLAFAQPLSAFPSVLRFLEDEDWQRLIQAVLATLIFTGIVAWIVGRSIARPIQNVTRGANAIAQGDYAHRIQLSGPLEIKELAGDLNAMAARVQVTQKAEREFIVNVSHELRTPMTSIKGFAQAIMDGTTLDSPQATQHAARVIFDESDRLSRLASALIDSARLETGDSPLALSTVSLNDLVRACVTRAEIRARDVGVELATTLGDLPMIVADGDRIVQVITNLVDNALKHTPQGGKVTLETRVAQGGTSNVGVRFAVSDNGEGIPPEDLPRIFDRFYQVDKSRMQKQDSGSGLGLAICKQIVDAHGGTISANSILGQGAQFVVWLPESAAITQKKL
jgi:signal transduction histidine kinase